jgi:hypothetical protein
LIEKTASEALARDMCLQGKKWEHHWAALAIYFAFYNFCRIHSSIPVTPAMQAAITDHVWKVSELLLA